MMANKGAATDLLGKDSVRAVPAVLPLAEPAAEEAQADQEAVLLKLHSSWAHRLQGQKQTESHRNVDQRSGQQLVPGIAV